MASHRIIRELLVIISMLIAIHALMENFIASPVDLEKMEHRDHHSTANPRQDKQSHGYNVSRGNHPSTRTFKHPLPRLSFETSVPIDMRTLFCSS